MNRSLVCALVVCVASCGVHGSTDNTPPARGVAPPASPTPAVSERARTLVGSRSRSPVLEGPTGRNDYRGRAEPVETGSTTVTERVDAPASPAMRDLPRELQEALGNAATCALGVDLSTANERMQIQVRVTVTATGVVTRSEVTSTTAPELIRACIAQRASSIHLRGDIVGAPRDVATTLSLDRVALPSPPPNPPANPR